LESYDKNLKGRSRQLRVSMTDAERLLWSKIRMGQINGLIFYRQKPIGEYIADFYCPKAKLVIEVDGSQHFRAEGIEYDKARDEYMKSAGLRILRFTNTEVLGDIEGVLERVLEKIPLNPETKIPLNPPFSKWETCKGNLNMAGRRKGARG
jgi:very-short-patch-repair endonuclease